jgi:actin-related protein
LSGASTMFPGYASRLLTEMINIYIEKGLKNAKDKTVRIGMNVIDSPRRKYSVFIGGTILANIYNTNKVQGEEYWISRQDWDEVGPDIILKKCQNIVV